MRKGCFWTIMLAIVLGVLAVVFFSPRSPVNKNHSSGMVPPPASAEQYPALVLPLQMVPLEGTWQWKENEIAFVGTVEGEHIKIDMVTADGTSMAYWDGSIKNTVTEGEKITSVRTDAVALSQDPTKDFTVSDGQMKFTFRYDTMGVTKTIAMTR